MLLLEHRHTAPCCGNVGQPLGATGGQRGGILTCGATDTLSPGQTHAASQYSTALRCCAFLSSSS